MNDMESVHKTVLLQETIDGLNLKNNSVVVDATFGGGGHSLEILLRNPNTKVIAIDQDSTVWERVKEKFKGLENRISFTNKNFRDIDKLENIDPVRSRPLEHESATITLGRPASNGIDGIIFDLGLSSDQLENSGRGFSFMKDEPLLMQMKSSAKENPSPEDVTALDVVNTWSEKSLADIIYGYGEEKFSRRIAKGIVETRQKKKIETTTELVEIISQAVPAAYRRARLHFATRTFQAIRIAVNDELGSLEQGLSKGFDALKIDMQIRSINVINNNVEKLFLRILLWSFATFLLWYIFLLGSMVFNIVERRTLEKEALVLSNQVHELELNYLSMSNKIDLTFAYSVGFKETNIKFATRKFLGFNPSNGSSGNIDSISKNEI